MKHICPCSLERLAPPRTQGPLDLAPVIVAIGLNWLYALVVGGARFDKET